MPTRQKVKFSAIAVRTKNRLFKRSNFLIKILEVPGATLEYFDIKRKYAIEAAAKAAPGCTFDIQEFSGPGDYKVPLDQVARAYVNGVPV